MGSLEPGLVRRTFGSPLRVDPGLISGRSLSAFLPVGILRTM